VRGVSKNSTGAALRAKFIPFDRNKIQVSQIVRRLYDHVQGKCQLSQTQIQAAKLLLGKALPDLVNIAHSGAVEQNIRYVEVPHKAPDALTWLEQQGKLIDVTPLPDGTTSGPQ
jgi:hypothetical protein